MDMTAEYETTINVLLAENDKLIKLVDWQNDEIERLREDNDKLQRMLKMAATWTAEPGVTIAEIREVFSLLDRAALGEKE